MINDKGGVVLVTVLATALCAASTALGQQEIPVDLGGGVSGESPSRLEEASGSALQIHGFAVADYGYDRETRDNSFDASAFALSVYRGALDNRLSLFGQLTVHRPEVEVFATEEEGAPAETPEEASVETEIDNLLIRWSANPKAGLDLTFGKFDSPLAIERDDAPLNYQATPSFLIDNGRPIKFTGLMLHEAFSPSFEGFLVAANGADVTPDDNHGKTGALYGRFSPSLGSHFGLGVIRGEEGEENLTRTTGIATLLLQPSPTWVVGGEAVSGRQERLEEPGSDRWSGETLFVHHRFTHRGGAATGWAATLRGEIFDDEDGARTGVAQRVTSVTVSPQYLVGGGFYGIFHYLDGTSLPLPQLAVRLDLRADHSDEAVFAGGDEEELVQNRYSADLQLVFVF